MPGLKVATRRMRSPNVEARIQEVELAIVSGKRPAEIVRQLQAAHGVSERTGERYCFVARERMRREAFGTDLETWHARLEGILFANIEAAGKRKRPVVLPSPDGASVVYIDDPDVNGVAKLVQVAANMRGLGGNGRGTTVNVNSGTTVQLVGPDAAKALAAFFTGGTAPAIDATPATHAPKALEAHSGAQALAEQRDTQTAGGAR